MLWHMAAHPTEEDRETAIRSAWHTYDGSDKFAPHAHHIIFEQALNKLCRAIENAGGGMPWEEAQR